MSSYKYKDPTTMGYKKVPISLKDLYKIGVGKRGSTLVTKACVYVKGDKGLIEYRSTLLAKALVILLSPVIMLANGFNKESLREIDRVLRQNKWGSFSSDSFSLQGESEVTKRLKDLVRSVEE